MQFSKSISTAEVNERISNTVAAILAWRAGLTEEERRRANWLNPMGHPYPSMLT